MTKENEAYFEVNQKRSPAFILVMVGSFIMQLGILYRPLYFLYGYPNIDSFPISKTYLWGSVALAILAMVGTVLTYFFRKMGVYLVLSAYFLIIVLQPEFSMTGSVATIFALFFFAVFGLLSIIPRWEQFR